MMNIYISLRRDLGNPEDHFYSFKLQCMSVSSAIGLSSDPSRQEIHDPVIDRCQAIHTDYLSVVLRAHHVLILPHNRRDRKYLKTMWFG